MKLAVISHAYQEQRYRATLRRMAKEADVELCLIHPAIYKGATFAGNEAGPMKSIAVPVRFGSRQGAFLYHAAALSRALDQMRPDLILHEQEVYTLGAAQITAVARQRSIPLVQFVWENVDRSLALPRRLIRRYVLSRTRALIAGSNRAAKVHRDWGFRGPIAIIPQMGVNLTQHCGPRQRDVDILKVCFVGRLVRGKGIDCLLGAIAELMRRGVSLLCTVAGEGPELESLRGCVRAFGIESAAHFCGQLSEDAVRDLLRASDVLVLPSRRTPAWQEQFGLVLTEAMAEGAVTVGSRTGAIPEVIGCQELLFEEDDVGALAAILARLATDTDFYVGCQKTLWTRARDLYSAKVLAAARVRFLRAVLDEVGSRVAGEPVTGRRLEWRLR